MAGSCLDGCAVAGPCADGPFAGRFGDGFDGRIAQGQQDASGADGFIKLQFGEGRAKSVQAEVRLAFAAIDAIEEGRDVDQLRPRIHEVKVEDLLASHGKI